jgi:hypothetical protein
VVFIGEHFHRGSRLRTICETCLTICPILSLFPEFCSDVASRLVSREHHRALLEPRHRRTVPFDLADGCLAARPGSIVKVCTAALCATLALRLILVPNFGDGIWLYALTSTRADGLLWERPWRPSSPSGRVSQTSARGLASAECFCLAGVATFAPVNETWLTDHLMSVIGISGVALLCGALIVCCLRYDESREAW